MRPFCVCFDRFNPDTLRTKRFISHVNMSHSRTIVALQVQTDYFSYLSTYSHFIIIKFIAMTQQAMVFIITKRLKQYSTNTVFTKMKHYQLQTQGSFNPIQNVVNSTSSKQRENTYTGSSVMHHKLISCCG